MKKAQSLHVASARLQALNVEHTLVLADAGDIYVDKYLDLVATTVHVQQLAQRMHWNVKGRQFQSAHKFFQEVYEYLFDLQDKLAEKVKTITDTNIDASVFWERRSLLKKTLSEFQGDNKYEDVSDLYYAYLTFALSQLCVSVKELSRISVSEDDIGAQDLLPRTVNELTTWIWKARSSIRK